MKKLLILIGTVSLCVFASLAFAGRGCCSHHGGQSYCSNGQIVCNDGTYSPSCTCLSNSALDLHAVK